MAITQVLQNAVPANVLDGVAAGVQNSSAFALPVKAPGFFSWQTVYGTVPGGITVNIQISNDGVSWTTVDTSTNVNGETRQISALTAVFMRVNISAMAGGTTVTVICLYKGRLLEGRPAFGTVLTNNVKQNGNVGAGLTTVMQFDIPANTLVNNGDVLAFESWAFLAANGNLKLSSISLTSGVTLAGRSGVADSGLPRLHRGKIVRTGAATAQSYGCVDTQGQGTLVSVTLPTDGWASVVSFLVKYQGTADNDLVHRGTLLWYVPVNGTYVGL